MTVAELLARVSSAELTEWQAYYRLNPFGLDRADYRAAQLCAVVANANRDSRRKPQPFAPSDFMPRFHVEPREVVEFDDPEAHSRALDRMLFRDGGDER